MAAVRCPPARRGGGVVEAVDKLNGAGSVQQNPCDKSKESSVVKTEYSNRNILSHFVSTASHKCRQESTLRVVPSQTRVYLRKTQAWQLLRCVVRVDSQARPNAITDAHI